MHPEYTPFDFLLSLEKDLLLSAKGLPIPQTSIDHWMGLSFLAGAHVMLVGLEEVVEIMPLQRLDNVPGVKKWLLGMVSCHGIIFPVTDLNGFLSEKNALMTHYSRIVVVKSNDDFAGFLVDRVLGLQKIPQKNVQKAYPHVIPEFAPFLMGGFTNKQIELPIISFKKMMQHPRFRDVSLKENIEDDA